MTTEAANKTLDTRQKNAALKKTPSKQVPKPPKNPKKTAKKVRKQVPKPPKK